MALSFDQKVCVWGGGMPICPTSFLKVSKVGGHAPQPPCSYATAPKTKTRTSASKNIWNRPPCVERGNLLNHFFVVTIYLLYLIQGNGLNLLTITQKLFAMFPRYIHQVTRYGWPRARQIEKQKFYKHCPFFNTSEVIWNPTPHVMHCKYKTRTE